MNKLASVTLLVLFSMNINAAPGPDSSWGELYQNRFYEPLAPVIPFYVHASTGADGRLFLKKVHDLSYFTAGDGRALLYGGTVRICTEYTVTGSLSDSRRRCLGYETVPLVRGLNTSLRYCIARSDDDCQAYASRDSEYPLQYSVPVMFRGSESDSFTPSRVAFSKTVQIPQCTDCAQRLGL